MTTKVYTGKLHIIIEVAKRFHLVIKANNMLVTPSYTLKDKAIEALNKIEQE